MRFIADAPPKVGRDAFGGLTTFEMTSCQVFIGGDGGTSTYFDFAQYEQLSDRPPSPPSHHE